MRVLVIDDDPEMAQAISLCFETRWPRTETLSAFDGKSGVSLAEKKGPDVVILAVGLPDTSGFEVCREIRRFSDVPIIMLTVRNAAIDAVRALELGADDYLTKPFSAITLLSRVQAVIRRTQRLPLGKNEGIFNSNNLRIDYDLRKVWMNGEMIMLTPTEYGLLYNLSRNANRVLTYQALLFKIWGDEYINETYLLKLHIHNLRHKLGDDLQKPRLIVNERGVGYRLIQTEQQKRTRVQANLYKAAEPPFDSNVADH